MFFFPSPRTLLNLKLGNTRVIAQNKLDEFREKMGEKMNDPYQVLMRQSKLPLSLLTEPAKVLLFSGCFVHSMNDSKHTL